MSTYWADACTLATGKSQQEQLTAVYASASVTVRAVAAALAADARLHNHIFTFFCSDCRLLRQRRGERGHVLYVAANG